MGLVSLPSYDVINRCVTINIMLTHAQTMAATVKQKNIERLIARCESILAGKTEFQGKEWKLPKVGIIIIFWYWLNTAHTHTHTHTALLQYVSALDDQIRELERFPG